TSTSCTPGTRRNTYSTPQKHPAAKMAVSFVMRPPVRPAMSGAMLAGVAANVAGPSPRDRAAIAKQTVGGAVGGECGEPDQSVARLFHGPRRARAAHVGSHPPRAHRVHLHVATDLAGEAASERVQRGLRDPVGG